MKQWAIYQFGIYQKVRNILLIILLIFVSATKVNAEDTSLNFYVTPEFPESQIEENERYFDLNIPPGNTEILTIELQNMNEKAKKIQITPHTAFTNVMGVVEYGKDAEEPDSSLSYFLSELIETPEPIELAGNETKTVELALKMPEEAFEGFLAGGLRVAEVQEEEKKSPTDEEGVAIKNEFAYVVGVMVSNRRDSVKADMELVDVFADQLNYRNVISANLQNFTPAFINRLKVEATVQKEGENDVLYEASKEGMQMAPNSNFNFPISLEGDRFQSGDYVLKLKATSGEEEWEWEKSFTIEADQARKFNQQDVSIDTTINWWFIGAVILILILLMIILWLSLKKKKENKKSDEKQKDISSL